MNRRLDNDRIIRSPRGPEMSAKSWLTEAPLRMLMTVSYTHLTLPTNREV